jgi:6-pyruvoyltetrahydropterin/6-carboxytetrahydropterin synthase
MNFCRQVSSHFDGWKMSESFKIRVAKDQLVFCSGHFISYEGGHCERLHGHNYRAAVEIEGPLDENHYIFDFIALKKIVQEIVDTLDHRMILPTLNPHIQVALAGPRVDVRYREREWRFPVGDCVLLPIANTTAELLAQWFAGQLRDRLRQRFNFVPSVMRVEIEEAPGQSATHEWRKAE